MSYQKTDWSTGDTITEVRLDHIEDGIFNNDVTITAQAETLAEQSKEITAINSNLSPKIIFAKSSSGFNLSNSDQTIPISKNVSIGSGLSVSNNQIVVEEDGYVIASASVGLSNLGGSANTITTSIKKNGAYSALVAITHTGGYGLFTVPETLIPVSAGDKLTITVRNNTAVLGSISAGSSYFTVKFYK